MVTIDLRALPVFDCAVSFDAPPALPVPTALTHAVLEDDDHEQPLLVVTVTLDEPPLLEKLTEVGDTE
jgi:hypothetical protein